MPPKNKITFFVAGDPRPQSRPRVVSKGGRTWSYSNAGEGLKLWRDSIAWTAKAAGPLTRSRAYRCELIFWMKRPLTHFKAGVLKLGAPLAHASTPDADNLAKAALDAIQGARLLEDDAAVAWLVVAKLYATAGKGESCGGRPGLTCTIEALGGTN